MPFDARSLVVVQGLVVDDDFAHITLNRAAPVERLAQINSDIRAMPEVRHLVASFERYSVLSGGGDSIQEQPRRGPHRPRPFDDREKDGLAVVMLEGAS